MESLISHAKIPDGAGLLAIRYHGERDGLAVEIHQTNSWNNPGWLEDQVVGLLAQRAKG